jgi:hypothetical protein
VERKTVVKSERFKDWREKGILSWPWGRISLSILSPYPAHKNLKRATGKSIWKSFNY